MSMNTDSELLCDPASPAGAALLALAVIGYVHPDELATDADGWRAARAELDACGWILDQDDEDRYFIANVEADGYPLGLPQKARAIVERNPAWRRAAVRNVWSILQERQQLARDFIARAVAEHGSQGVAA